MKIDQQITISLWLFNALQEVAREADHVANVVTVGDVPDVLELERAVDRLRAITGRDGASEEPPI